MRRSVFARVLAVAVLVALCSIAATAWLATQLTRASIEREQGRELAADNRIYATLLEHATRHRDWSDAGGVLASLVEANPHRRITLVAKDGGTLADVGGDRGPLPSTAAAVVDALAVDPVLVPDAPADRVDERVLGPFRTPIQFREREDRTGSLGCLRDTRKGRDAKDCQESRLSFDTAADFAALLDLEDIANGCLARKGLPEVELDPDFTPARKQSTGSGVPDEPAVAGCVAASRKEQLAPYVAPPALLYLSSPSTAAISLSGNGWQVAGAAGAVLLVAAGVTALVGARITRPLRALTAAARHMSDGGVAPPVRVSGHDEVADLARAFNTMAANRARLEQARRAVVGDVAHELRTPLSNIRGWLEAAEDGVSDGGPELTALLLKEALVLQHVVDDLQDLAVADAGELRLVVEEVPVAEAFEQVRAAHGPQAAQAGVVLSAAAAELVVVADPVRLRQILDNLVTNALRYVPAGGSVALAATRDGSDVLITVADTGGGIAADDVPHVFDRFWRADRSRARATGGSGLGLSIVRKFVEAHGGSVAVASTLGKGTTFTLRFPT
ncbi:sensor histidine kinase [Umezawaea endophytica]|uniref:histidine kinase n=1 Tax=Umezawaea endophytica TaxID=1654476 RepID=A0A9X2ZXW2_9PSEU|nr:HAMP domain-containing sensor histidine kinase [Umezawaea endophytica]MCS7475784.1 HAMP domain-containing histidine kinase [Umezawaea endophytica]